jgi:5-formyltetrahydrofolate cyclo-ligase
MSSSSNPTKIEKLSAEAARKTVLEKLKNLSPDTRLALSTQICERAIHALGSLPLRSVALYRSLPSEVNLEGLEQYFQKKGTALCYPRIADDRESSLFCHVPEPEKAHSWNRNTFGVDEPSAQQQEVEPGSVDCIVVPGLAFGEQGERVGRGKGHYDRLLARETTAIRVVLAFDFQLFEALEQNAWDQPVHWIMTEKRELRLR